MFKDYLSFYPEDGNTLFSYALFLSDRKRYDESLDYLVKASKYAPENARIMYNTAMMFDFKQDFEKAEKYIKKAIQVNPQDSNNHMALLNLYLKYQKTIKSKQQARVILDKFPNIQDKKQIQSLLN